MRFLKPAIIGIVALVTSQAATAQEVTRQEEEAVLKELKVVDWREIYATGDADRLEQFLAEEFVLIGGSDGFTPKSKEVSSLRESGGGVPEDFLYHVEDIIWVNEDAVIIYGRGTSTRTNADGGPCYHSYLSSNVLRREDSEWHPVSSHVSDAECSAVPSPQ